MADDKQKNADFVGHVVGDPKNPQETRMLTGWFGESGEEGCRRLYTDAELSNYVDIPDDAILYSEPLKDVQPSGGVLVWIKRDAALKQGGSASSRAARFLQGQVQQDFASAGAAGSLEKAGLRCATQVPCGEPTGFTGECTQQPEVGGAWPCITAIPHCFEVTGFTGKCTHAPWPNPTRYIGCTQLHCPTYDLTHIPHICNIVASGQPGCVVINTPQEGDPAQKAGTAADAEAKPLPATEIPGCGYTKSWGVCETHLLGCGHTKDCPPTLDCPQQFARGVEPQQTDYPLCMQARAAAGGAAAQPASAICATAIGCDITFLCHTRFPALCFPTLICATQPQQCFPIPSPFCPITQACPFGQGGGGDPAQRFAAFGAAANAFVPTAPPCASAIDACPTHPCDTKPPTALCTPNPQFCPTFCGVDCQTKQPHPVCTSVNCLTHTDPQCSPSNVFHDCTSIGSTCPTKLQPGCPTTDPKLCATHPPPVCNIPNVGAQAFAAQAIGLRPAPLSQVGCPASDFVACSQFGGCPTLPNGDCTFFGCPSLPQQFAAAGPGGGCTQSGPQCPTHAKPQCTFVGPACPPTPATVCTQFAPCPTHQGPHCPSKQFECTFACTHNAPGCPQSQNPACFGPLTVGGPQCPPASGFNCPSQFGCQSIACGQSIACVSAACQPGGGGQQVAAHLVGGAQFTEFENCTQFGPHCPTFFHCPHTAGTACSVIAPECPPPTIHGPVCPVTSRGPQCPPPASRFHCLSPFCAPGAGQQEGGPAQFNAFAAHVAPNFTPACPSVRCHTPFCAPTDRPYCPNFTPSPVWCSRFCPVTEPPNCQHTEALECTRLGPQCPAASDFVCPSGFCAGGGLGGDPFAGGGGVHPDIAARHPTYIFINCTWYQCPSLLGPICWA